MGRDEPILITGVAGFIGYHLALRLVKAGHTVIGIDNLTPYYDIGLKESRLKNLQTYSNFKFIFLDITNGKELEKIFETYPFKIVLHMAAQAGVRYSLESPQTYINSNIVGFMNILECCRHSKTEHLIYASSSSVYGNNKKTPFSPQDSTDSPVSLYGATKKANEVMAYSYAKTFNLFCTGLRFFTVYGPWGRPDMALFLFTEAILQNKPIDLFNYGEMQRDFTYIDDIVDGILCIMSASSQIKSEKLLRKEVPYQIYNLGHGSPLTLQKVVETLENYLGKKADKRMLPIQPGDVPSTHADMSEFEQTFNFKPKVTIEEGVKNFVEWYKAHYSI